MITAKMNVVHVKFSKLECTFSSVQNAYQKKKKRKEKLKTKKNSMFLAKSAITFTSNLDEWSVCLHLSKCDQLKCI